MNDFYENAYELMDILEQELSYEDMFDLLWEMEAKIVDNDNDNDISQYRGIRCKN